MLRGGAGGDADVDASALRSPPRSTEIGPPGGGPAHPCLGSALEDACFDVTGGGARGHVSAKADSSDGAAEVGLLQEDYIGGARGHASAKEDAY